MRLQYDTRGTRRVEAAAQFGRVAVLLGGTSSEREISLISGKAVLAGLERRLPAYPSSARELVGWFARPAR